MMDFSLRDRDLEIINGDFALCQSEAHAIAQAITIRLRTLAGEWFLDTRAGIPYLSHILGKKQSERLLRKLISEAVKSLPSVITIKEFVVKAGPGERSITISFNAVLSDQSAIAINESIGV